MSDCSVLQACMDVEVEVFFSLVFPILCAVWVDIVQSLLLYLQQTAPPTFCYIRLLTDVHISMAMIVTETKRMVMNGIILQSL